MNDGSDKFFDPFDLNLIPAPPRTVRFAPKLKGKLKSEPSHSHDEQLAPLRDPKLKSTIPTPMEEDDPVVREINVFCTPLEDDAQLYVMQYPLRPSWRPYELEERCEEVKVRPKRSEVEVVLGMDVDSENYDEDAPNHRRMQKQILSSSRATSIADYASGIMIENQLHLNPIHALLQFRPSVNKKHKSQEVGNKSEKGKMVEKDLSDQIDDAEPWVPLEYNPVGSTSSCKYQQKLMAPQAYNIDFTSNPSEYMDSLCPRTSTIMAKPNVPLTRFFPSMPVEERVKKWLCERCQVNRFDALIYLNSTVSNQDFLEMLQRHAYLVQGLWVSKSSLICGGHEAKLRDYILFLLSENHVIKNTKLKGLKIKDQDLKTLLRPLARERPSLGDWILKEERDSLFLNGHPQIATEQNFAWSTRGKYLLEYLSKPLMAKKPVPNTAKRKPVMHKVDSASDRVNEGSGSLASAPMSNEIRRSLKKALLHIYRDQKPRSINSICRDLQQLAISISSRPKEDPRAKALVNAITTIAASGLSHDFLSLLKEVTVEVHNVYFLRPGGDPALDPLREIVLRLFSSNRPNAKLKKQEIVEAAKAGLKRDIPDSEYNKVVSELCVHDSGELVLRGVDKAE